MTNIIEESMIINRLTSPQKLNNPNQSPLRLTPILPNSYKHSSRQSSKANLLDIHNHKNVDQQDSDNVANPMSSQVDLTQDEAKENDIELDVKQVLTEINDQQTNSYQNLDEIQPDTQSQQPQLIVMQAANTIQNQIQKHKQIIIKNPQIGNTIQNQHHQKPQQIVEKEDIPQDNNKNKSLDRQMIENLKEIYSFYSKQAITTNKYNTFEKLQQLSNIMILQKFMFFCRDFELIDLEINNDLILNLGGKIDDLTNKKKNQFKFNHKQNFILTKFNLVEVYKKNANSQMELTKENFQIVIIKIAQLIFPDQNELLYEYLGLNNPRLYRKKMQIIGKPFNSKEQGEVLTQEKLYERKIYLPPKPKLRVESVKKERLVIEQQFPKVNLTQRCKRNFKQMESALKDGNGINWSDLDDLQSHFDPKKFILEQDLSDKEDDYYLQEYSKHGQSLKKKIQDQMMNQKELQIKIPQISIYSNILSSNHKQDHKSNVMLTSGNTRPSNNKSFDLQDNQQRKQSVGQSPQNIEQTSLEKQNQIYRAFLNQQSYRERMVNKKKLIVI
ncbi:unnamed protein product (macronuclear) [Paramecium tetraurelia]|uniref:Uncharacterized protein n=1 Tax=Paramecium tetraurelia TaxID=5888 RepID=A0EDB2_PARTE|nr:uncharacterized protein GSPATT00004148001 [Paramecium tetraurelia]CAK93279.1 unnamed protein product [Paramecium tetraurelia]|eukprot:XP_001460676.1 hypothetical protein (macronuclear) [Paramecium tetraurelia strain d4-2]